jgi:hypothetical protein
MKVPPANIEIRSAVLEDAAGIRALTRAAYAKWVPLIGREPLPMQADYERAVAEHTIDLIIAGGALAGLVETILRPDHLVDREYRGRAGATGASGASCLTMSSVAPFSLSARKFAC